MNFYIATIYPLLFFIILTGYGSTSIAGLGNTASEMTKDMSPAAFILALHSAIETVSKGGLVGKNLCKIRKVSDKELALQPVAISNELKQELSDILNGSDSNDRSAYIHRPSAGCGPYDPYDSKLDKSLKLLSRNQTIHLGAEAEPNLIIPSVHESLRVDGHIVKNCHLSDIPTAHVLDHCRDAAPSVEKCLKIRDYHMGVFSYDEYWKHRYIYTESVFDCVAIILWDRKTYKACMAHFKRQDINEQSLSAMKHLICPAEDENGTSFTVSDNVLMCKKNESEPKATSTFTNNCTNSLSENQISNSDIKMTAIGGNTRYLMEKEGLFPTLEGFAERNNVTSQ